MKIELNKKQVDFILSLLYRAELNMKGESLNTAKSAMQVFNMAAHLILLRMERTNENLDPTR